ncbi:MAG TPA: hypothetical protein DCE56_28760 [Cyanobacteria bacterium UBA8553]|nr:hypothetical protein [Cyanobacteria bacterium UBA8553]HAJ62617.1 hypothetical protein [Cyanobacteria bacterium UBA8543]
MANLFEQAPYQLHPIETDLTAAQTESAWLDRGFIVIVWTFALATVALLFVMSWVIFKDAQLGVNLT